MEQQNKLLFRTGLLALLLLLTACGFHMRGAVELPAGIRSVYIESSQDSAMLRYLKNSLEASGVRLVSDAAHADAVLALSNVRRIRRVLTVGSDGRALEYELLYSVDISLTGRNNKVILKKQSMSLTRQYRHDDAAVLGGVSEEGLIWKEMERDMAQAVVRRLSTIR